MFADLISIGIALEDFKVILVLLPLILAIRAWNTSNPKIRLFCFYIGFGVLNVVSSLITSRLGNNIFQSYLYAPIEIIFLTLILLPKKEDKGMRLFAYILASAALMMNIIEAFFFKGGVGVYNSATYIIISLALGSLAIRQLLVLRFDIMVDNLSKEPLFWIGLSVAIHKFGNLINWSFFRTVQLSGDDAILIMGFTRIIISYIHISLNAVALWKAQPRMKSPQTSKSGYQV